MLDMNLFRLELESQARAKEYEIMKANGTAPKATFSGIGDMIRL